jgi:hypothetical protein
MIRRILAGLLVTIAVAAAEQVGPQAGPASAQPVVTLGAEPNPALSGQTVRFTIEAAGERAARLQAWISAMGVKRPGLGNLPTGHWDLVCCPAQTAGDPAWHYRSDLLAQGGRYTFRAVADRRGSHVATAAYGAATDSIVFRVA